MYTCLGLSCLPPIHRSIMYGHSSFMTKDGILNLHLSSVQIWYFSFVAIGVLHLLIWYAVFPDQSWPGSWGLQRPWSTSFGNHLRRSGACSHGWKPMEQLKGPWFPFWLRWAFGSCSWFQRVINCAGKAEFEVVDRKRMTKIHDKDFRLITR